MKKYLLIILVVFFAGCKVKTPIVQVPIKTIERRVSTLVPIFVGNDSASISALLECDSLNNVILKDLAEAKSKNMKSDFSFEDGRLNYNAKTERDTVYIPSDTVFFDKEIPVTVEVVKKEYRMNKVQTVFFYIGLITAMGLLSWLVIKLKIIK